MTNQVYVISQAASQVGISPSGVRRLCQEYASNLSQGANPGGKLYRRFSQADVEVLQEIVRLKAQGLTPDAIKEQLATLVFSAPITESPSAAQEGRSEALAPVAMIAEAMRSVTAPLEARQDAQDERLQALEAQRLRIDVAWLVVGAFIAGLIVGLAVWWF